jgi:O-antigen ligase
MIHLMRGDWLARDVARAISVPVFVIGLAALIGSLWAGLHVWIINFLVRDIAVVLAFLSSIDILRRGGPRAVRLCYGALGICIVLAAVQLGTSGGNELRASGTFPNPNIPGNLLAIAILCWTAAPFRWTTKGAVIFVALVGLLAAASFGSMLQLAVGFGYLAFSNVDKATRLMRGRRLLMVVPILLIAVGGYFAFSQLKGGSETGFNQARFDRSGGTRGQVWEEALGKYWDAPMGVGPGSVRGYSLNSYATELHSEPLAYLIERGPIGLFGLLLMWFVMVRLAPAGTNARAMVYAYIVGSFFRETAHYRHFWLLLGLALVAAEQRRRELAVQDVVLV